MTAASTTKRQILDDDLARELYAEETRRLAGRHVSETTRLNAWADEREAYLKAREECNTIAEAEYLLSVLEAHRVSKTAKTGSTVASLHQLGQVILARKYETSLSSYVYEEPTQVQQREADLAARWLQLDELATAKQPFLEDHLARNQFQNKVRLMVSNHSDSFGQIKAWVDEKAAYLDTRESVTNVPEARLQLNLLAAYGAEKEDMAAGANTTHSKLGADIRAAEYKSTYSQWKYEKPEQVSALETQVQGFWALLTEKSDEKQRVLDDHLVREEYAEQTRLLAAQHDNRHSQLTAWGAEKLAYLAVREDINTVQEAHYQLSVHDAFVKEKQAITASAVASLKVLGQTVLAREHKSSYSNYVYEHPTKITDREGALDAQWSSLDQQSSVKLPILEDHLARNVFQNKVL